MPTIESQNVIDQISDLVIDHIEKTGESKVSIAARAGVRAELLSRLINNSYGSSPSLEICSKIAKAVGANILVVKSRR